MEDSHGRLTLEFAEQPYGRCLARVTDLDGNVLREQVYKNKNSAQASIRTWLKKEGLETSSITRVHPEDDGQADEQAEADEVASLEPAPVLASEAAPTAPASPTDRWLVKLRQEAQRALNEALKLRLKADDLEAEHERLTAAADVLEGPEG
jgi:hypothetical protein